MKNISSKAYSFVTVLFPKDTRWYLYYAEGTGFFFSDRHIASTYLPLIKVFCFFFPVEKKKANLIISQEAQISSILRLPMILGV